MNKIYILIVLLVISLSFVACSHKIDREIEKIVNEVDKKIYPKLRLAKAIPQKVIISGEKKTFINYEIKVDGHNTPYKVTGTFYFVKKNGLISLQFNPAFKGCKSFVIDANKPGYITINDISYKEKERLNQI